jgi:hypothetical protein
MQFRYQQTKQDKNEYPRRMSKSYHPVTELVQTETIQFSDQTTTNQFHTLDEISDTAHAAYLRVR